MAAPMETDAIPLTADNEVFKEILQPGTGDELPAAGCKVSLHYTGRLTDGTEFDSSVGRGEPFEFTLGRSQVIKAFDLGVATMKLGEKCKLTCGSKYAYGPSGSPPNIPPNATLIFELEMLGWKGDDLSPNMDGSIERIVIENSEKKRNPFDGGVVKVHVEGRHAGRVFDERVVEFDYGDGSKHNLPDGLQIAVGKMSVGEKSKIKLKPKYAFGAAGSAHFGIPPDAEVEYVVSLLECERDIDEWRLSDAEKLDQAAIYKKKGTDYLQSENFSLALKMYQKSAEILPDKPDEDGEEGGKELLEKVRPMKIAALSNQILCYMKMNELLEGKKVCDEVLELDPDNVKVLYRRGVCNMGIHEYKAAAEDFEGVLELQPNNKAAQQNSAVCAKKIKEAHAQERKIYANMFTKFAASDKKTSNEGPQPGSADVLNKCGEWDAETTTKCEADLAFERDDIVMI